MLTFKNEKTPSHYELILPSTFNNELRLTIRQIIPLTGNSRSKIFADVKSGKFPQPERYSSRQIRWRAGDVLEFLKARRAGSIPNYLEASYQEVN